MTVHTPQIPNRFWQATPRAYAFSTAAFTPAASATDIFTLSGAADRVVRLIRLVLSGTQTTAGNVTHVSIVKRSAANTTGTAVATTITALDSMSAAATATAQHYTANPGALGTGVTIWQPRVLIAAPGTTTVPGVIFDLDFTYHVNSPPFGILRSASEFLAISLGGTTPSGAAEFQVSGIITED